MIINFIKNNYRFLITKKRKINCIFIFLLLIPITFSNCFQFGKTEDNRNRATKVDIANLLKGGVLMAGQSNMEGNVPGDLFNDIVDQIKNNNGDQLKTNLEATLKDWYDNHSGGCPNSDERNALEAQELVRLKNEGIVGDFLKVARKDVWASFNSNTVSGLKDGFGNPIGSELTLGQYLGNKANASISLIKVAHGGTTLYGDWLSPSGAARLGKPVGPLYIELKNRIQSIKSNPSSVNPDYKSEWQSFVWFQGENDCFGESNAQTYEANLRDLIKDVRNEIGKPDLPVVVVELNAWASGLTYGKVILAAQNAVAASDPNVEIVKCNDLSWFYHMDPAAHFIVGERIGKALEKLLLLNASQSVNGLTAEYFHNHDLSDLAYVKVDRDINFNWGGGSPDDIWMDTFSVRWTGYIKTEQSQKYTFHTMSDDGVRLLVDNKVIIDNWGNHPPTEDTGTIFLEANKYYSIQLEYCEYYGGAAIKLFWSGPNQPKEIIPFSHLYNHNKYKPGGLRVTYYKDINFVENAFSRVDPTINFYWGLSSPASSMDPDFFSARWTGYIKPEYSETYNFTTVSDDGVRLWVDNKLIIDNWTVHPPQEDTGNISLTAGKLHKIKLEYYEYAGGARIDLYWSSSHQGKEIIPYTNLFYDNNPAPGTEPLEYGLRNTILVPMPMDASSTWKDLAFLAAVPAGMKINRGRPSVIAMPDNKDINEYHYNYLDRYKPTNVFAIGNVPGYSGAVQLNSSSLDDLTCDLARFWQKSDTVVIVQTSYYIGLGASALAARLNVPLFFKNNGTISEKTMDCFKKLGVKKVISVGSADDIAGQLDGAGIGVETISSLEGIISWLVANGHEIDYFAVCNSYDRTNTYAPRSALAAPILAAGRSGVVVPLSMGIEFQTPCTGFTETETRPNGAAMSQPYQGKTSWKVGSCMVNGQNYKFALSRRKAEDSTFLQGNIDFNGDGNYSDNFFVTGEKRNFGGKEYLIACQSNGQYADLRFTYPDVNVIKAYIQNYHNSLGHHPKYMALVGLPDTLPPLLVPEQDGSEWFTDQIYSDVDSDSMFDIAIGRIVGENASYSTLNATRSITYNDLLDSSWKNNATTYGCFLTNMYSHKYLLENRGFSVDYFPNTNNLSDGVDRNKYNIFVHEGHGWSYGISPQCLGPSSPSLNMTSGCSFGSIAQFSDPGKEYKDFTAVQLAKVGSVGFHAFGVNAGGDFLLTRECFLNALLYQDATLGEAYLYAQNSNKMIFNSGSFWDKLNTLLPMFYGDPALKIYLPPAQPIHKPARVEVNGNTATLLAPGNIWVGHDPVVWPDPNFAYDYMAPGLAWVGGGHNEFHHRADKRFIAKFTVNGTVTNITQQPGIPDNLGWFYSDANSADEYKIDKHWDGTSTVYINARLYIFDYMNGQIKSSVSKIPYSLTLSGVPDGYTWCAHEGGSFTLPGACDVAYGANGTFTYLKNKTGTIAFNNNTFGDPIVGVYKAGYYKRSGPDGYTWCANEGGSFTLPGTCDVAYGENGTFTHLYDKTGTITFNNSTFGDPVPGVPKAGYFGKCK